MKQKSKIQNAKSKLTNQSETRNAEPKDETPEYFLADVPQDLRLRLLDLCFRRYWHQALELLRSRGFDHYTQDDLISFYHWAPKELPGQRPVQPEPTPQLPHDYAQPPPEQIEDLRNRLTALPPDVVERVHHALKHEPLDHAASILWHAGAAFASAELYEYRKTLFPPNAMVDPYSAGPPVLRTGKTGLMDSAFTAPLNHSSTDPIIHQSAHSDPEPRRLNPEPATTDNGPLTTEDEQETPTTSIHEAMNPSIHQSINPSGIILLSDLRNIIRRYVVLPEFAPETLALWVVHTYAFTLRDVTTYIGVVSPEKRCGKTTLLELLGLLSHDAITAANISASALFRVIAEKQPTLIIDEADTFLQRRDEMAGILNAGYRKSNAYVVRVSDGKARRKPAPRTSDNGPRTTDDGPLTTSGLAQYSCWCPKVMAAIGRLPDTLADRCIVITMQRKMPGEQCERRRRLNAAEIRERCADFVREHSQAIATAQPDIPASLNDRAADIWEPLLAIADLAGGDWPALAREAAEKLSGSQDDEVTLVGYFLRTFAQSSSTATPTASSPATLSPPSTRATTAPGRTSAAAARSMNGGSGAKCPNSVFGAN